MVQSDDLAVAPGVARRRTFDDESIAESSSDDRHRLSR
jgi:hypothetical protein